MKDGGPVGRRALFFLEKTKTRVTLLVPPSGGFGAAGCFGATSGSLGAVAAAAAG